MNIKLGIGIGELKFGMKEEECIHLLGTPTRLIEDEDREDEKILEFAKVKLRLSFYLEEDNKLSYIRSSNQALKFKDQLIIGQPVELLKSSTFKEEISDWEIAEYDYFNCHSNEKYWLTLNEEYGEVTSVELGVPFKNDMEYNWPK